MASPAIRTVEDLGDDQRYFRVITNGAERALDAIGTRRHDLDELGLIIMNQWILGKLASTYSTKLSRQQREKLKSLMESSTTSILEGMSQEDPIYKTTLFKFFLMILSKAIQFVGRFTSAPPL